jgi:hypothetical protein
VGEEGTATMRVLAAAEGLSVLWKRGAIVNGTLQESGTIGTGVSTARGMDTPVLSLRNVTKADEGIYFAEASVPGGDIIRSGTWNLFVVPRVRFVQAMNPPLHEVIPGSNQIKFQANVEGNLIESKALWQWYFRPSGASAWAAVPGATAGNLLTLNNVQDSDEGEYRVEVTNFAGTSISPAGALVTFKPLKVNLLSADGLAVSEMFIPPPGAIRNGTLHPSAGSVVLQGSVTGGTLSDSTFQFFRMEKAVAIPFAEKPMNDGRVTITGIAKGSSLETSYRVRAFGQVQGKVDSSLVKVTVMEPAKIGAFTPVNSNLVEGDALTLRVPLGGYQPQVQWYRNNIPLDGETSDILSLVPAAAIHSGSYSVRVWNQWANKDADAYLERAVAQVTVSVPPQRPILTTVKATLVEGETVRIVGSLSGTQSRVNYQWRRNGQALSSGVAIVPSSGTVTLTYEKQDVQAADAGVYELLVSNAFGVSLSEPLSVGVLSRARILSEPENAFATINGSAIFRVEVQSLAPVTYEWWRRLKNPDRTEFLGTQSACTVKSLSKDDDDSVYWVVASTNGETLTSRQATLRVADYQFEFNGPTLVGKPDGRLSISGVNQIAATVSSGTINAGSLRYQWRKDGVALANAEGVAPVELVSGSYQYTLNLNLPPVTSDSEGLYELLVNNGVVFASSKALPLNLEFSIGNLTAPSKVNPLDPLLVQAELRGAVKSYQWFVVSGSGVASPLQSAPVTSNIGSLASFSLPSVPLADRANYRGTYRLVVTGTSNAVLRRDTASPVQIAEPVVITRQPVARAVLTSGTARISVVAAGDDLVYQWRRDGVDLAGGTSATLDASNPGLYQVLISNAFSSQLSSAVSVVTPGALEVAVPEPGSVAAGGVVNLVANATGLTAGRTYQWYAVTGATRMALAGANSDTYKISPVRMSDAGDYVVEVTAQSASGGTITAVSNPVNLQVKSLPSLVVPLASRTVEAGSTTGQAKDEVSFRVVAKPGPGRSAADLRYAWYRDGQLMAGATSASIRTKDVAAYTVQVYHEGAPDDFVSSKASLKTVSLGAGSASAEKTAGSAGTDSVHTGWWVYWVKATRAGRTLKGYYALERTTSGEVVIPGRSLWVLAADAAESSAEVFTSEWIPGTAGVEHRVVDAVASERSEFSVLASHNDGSSFSLSGRLETGGDAALYGAPDLVAGEYAAWKDGPEDLAAEDFDLELLWDNERTLQLGVLGNADVIQSLKDELNGVLMKGD